MKRRGWTFALALPLAGCGDEPLTIEELVGDATEAIETGWFEGEQEYGASQSVEALKVPPELSLPDTSRQLVIPELGGVSAKQTGRGRAAVLPEFVAMKVRREGAVRWLEVGLDPVTLWPHLRTFLLQQGYELISELPVVGVLETRWRERQDALQAAAGQEAGRYYAATREKYRMRVEREPNAYTNVFVAQQEMQVAGIDANQVVVWKPGPPNPDREAEMLVRLMEHLGATRLEGIATLEEEEAVEPVELDLQYISGVPVLLVDDDYSSVWRQTGVALERSGLAVVDADREQGTYVVRYRGRAAPAGEELLLEVHLLAREDRVTLVTAHYHDSDEVLPQQLTREVLRHVVAAYALTARTTAQAEE